MAWFALDIFLILQNHLRWWYRNHKWKSIQCPCSRWGRQHDQLTLQLPVVWDAGDSVSHQLLLSLSCYAHASDMPRSLMSALIRSANAASLHFDSASEVILHSVVRRSGHQEDLAAPMPCCNEYSRIFSTSSHTEHKVNVLDEHAHGAIQQVKRLRTWSSCFWSQPVRRQWISFEIKQRIYLCGRKDPTTQLRLRILTCSSIVRTIINGHCYNVLPAKRNSLFERSITMNSLHTLWAPVSICLLGGARFVVKLTSTLHDLGERL
jgi:hypothetical protein